MDAFSVEGSFDDKQWAFSCEANIQKLEPNLWEDR